MKHRKININFHFREFCLTNFNFSVLTNHLFVSIRKIIAIANEATDKQLISRIYKQLLQLNSRKISDPIKKLVF